MLSTHPAVVCNNMFIEIACISVVSAQTTLRRRLAACCWYSTGSRRDSSGEASTRVSSTARSGYPSHFLLKKRVCFCGPLAARLRTNSPVGCDTFNWQCQDPVLPSPEFSVLPSGWITALQAWVSAFTVWLGGCFVSLNSLTPAQICDLPPGTISDIVNEHNLTVHWTEKHTHRDCALYTGEQSRLSDFDADSGFLILSTSSQRSKRELVSRLGHGSGAFQVPSGSVVTQWWTLLKKPLPSALLLPSLQERTVGGEDIRVAVGDRVVQRAARTGATQQM